MLLYNEVTSENFFFKKRNQRKRQSTKPTEVFFGKVARKNFTKFTGRQLCQSFFFNNVACLRFQWLFLTFVDANFCSFLLLLVVNWNPLACNSAKEEFVAVYFFEFCETFQNVNLKENF